MKSLSTGARVFITLLIFTILFFIGCYLMEMSIDDDSNNHINRMPEYDEVIMAEIECAILVVATINIDTIAKNVWFTIRNIFVQW